MPSADLRKKKQTENTKNLSGEKNNGATNSNSHNSNNNDDNSKKGTEMTETQEMSVHPVRHVEKRTTPQRCYFGANAANRPLPEQTTSRIQPSRTTRHPKQ